MLACAWEHGWYHKYAAALLKTCCALSKAALQVGCLIYRTWKRANASRFLPSSKQRFMEDSMAQQSFSVGKAPRVIITQVDGDLSVRTWKEQAVSIETGGTVASMQPEGDTLTIVDCDSDIKLIVPEDASIKSTNITGDVTIEGVRRVELENVAGDTTIKNVSGDAGLENIGEAIDLTNLGGDLSVTNVPILRVRHSVGGDATLQDVAVIAIETIGSDLTVARAETAMISTVGGVLSAVEIAAALRCGVVG